MFYGSIVKTNIDSVEESYNIFKIELDNLNKIIESTTCLQENSIVLELDVSAIIEKIKGVITKFINWIKESIAKFGLKLKFDAVLRNVDKEIKQSNGNDIKYKVIKDEDFEKFKDYATEMRAAIKQSQKILNTIASEGADKDKNYGKLDYNMSKEFDIDNFGKTIYNKYGILNSGDTRSTLFDEKSNDANVIKNELKKYFNLYKEYLDIHKEIINVWDKFSSNLDHNNPDTNMFRSISSLTRQISDLETLCFNVMGSLTGPIAYFAK
jgi:hypothetical protein